MSVEKATHFVSHHLRFVERDGKQILQQLWETSYIELENEWRDVPLVKEENNAT